MVPLPTLNVLLAKNLLHLASPNYVRWGSTQKNLCKFIVAIPGGKGFLLNRAKYLFEWGAGAIMTACSS